MIFKQKSIYNFILSFALSSQMYFQDCIFRDDGSSILGYFLNTIEEDYGTKYKGSKKKNIATPIVEIFENPLLIEKAFKMGAMNEPSCANA